ncbi:MAG: C69 family dipeptidase [Bacteroidales bacterium]|nr:C69 family dipeptidase [Bacteroidales bacterium]MBQ3978585.1 C69 family dipeptidase [Bacteroidales bacterium]MBQ5978557.1 C69 family dipeptidase [Bacteroidales bacterium]
MTGRSIIGAVLAAALLLSGGSKSKACTNIIVTRGASADNSNIISYAADSHVLYGELYFHPAAIWKPGTMLDVIDWDSYRPLGSIPQVERTYKTVGNMNEYQLIIGETTWGGRRELHDPKGIMDYGSLIYITLQRAKTAREAIQTIIDLANEYGYASSGETFSIADKNEAWVMDLVGKGPDEKGINYVAIRIPDGYICSHANQARIQTFPQNDPENCIFAPGMIDFARKHGWFSGKDEDFDYSAAFGPVDFGGARACDARAWSAFNILTGGEFTYEKDGKMVTEPASAYYDYITGKNLSHRMPLFVKPSKKISVKNVADAMRDHFEGTPLDMTTDIGAGGNALPYRWRPMNFSKDGWSYVNERAIATQQTGFWFVAQSRHDLPDVVGGIIWFGTDDAATSYLTPIYSNTNEVPECFKEGNGNMLEYSKTASFWINNRVANDCYKAYNMMAPTVREAIDKFENEQMFTKVAEMDAKALAAYNSILAKAEKKGLDSKDWFAPVKKLLTDYSVSTAQKQFWAWVDLEEMITVKFIDGNVKAQDEDGNFKHSKYNKGTPAGITNPGYTEKWKEAVIQDHGDVLRVR